MIKALYRTTMSQRPLATVSGLDGLGHLCPTRLHVRLRHILVEQRFQNRPRAAHSGRPLLSICDATTLSALTAARIIGHERRARPTERCAMPAIHRSGHGGVMRNAATTLDHERYTRHDIANWHPIRTALISFGYKRSVPPPSRPKRPWPRGMPGATPCRHRSPRTSAISKGAAAEPRGLGPPGATRRAPRPANGCPVL